MTTKNAKTVLFASLIAALVLPFLGMQMADAIPSENSNKTVPDSNTEVTVDWSTATESSESEIANSGSVTMSTNYTSTTCNHYASMSNKCQGWDNIYSTWYYRTPNTYLTPDYCESYTCADTDHYQWAPTQISSGGYAYAFESATFYACALETGVCTSPTTWTSPYGATIYHNDVPTDEPITATTAYVYERSGGQQVTYVLSNHLNQGYS